MDDGFLPWPNHKNINTFLNLINDLDENLEFIIEPAKHHVNVDGKVYQELNFLDIMVILHADGNIETDVYYKETNSHDYLNFNSHHPYHIKKNIPYNLAKRIIIFCSNPDTVRYRLEDLKSWLLNCGYPIHIITQGFHNAKLQGPAPKPKPKNDTLAFVTTFYSNYDSSHIPKLSNDLLKSSRNEDIVNTFGSTNTVLALRQPKCLLRHITTAKYISTQKSEKCGLFKCTCKRCKICKLYHQECMSFIPANNKEWIIKCHIS